MATKPVVCPDCGALVPYGRLSCAECGSLIASVAGAPVRQLVRAEDAGEERPSLEPEADTGTPGALESTSAERELRPARIVRRSVSLNIETEREIDETPLANAPERPPAPPEARSPIVGEQPSSEPPSGDPPSGDPEVATFEPEATESTSGFETIDSTSEAAAESAAVEPVAAEASAVEPSAEPLAAEASAVEPSAEPLAAEAPAVEPSAEPLAAEPVAEPVAAPETAESSSIADTPAAELAADVDTEASEGVPNTAAGTGLEASEEADATGHGVASPEALAPPNAGISQLGAEPSTDAAVRDPGDVTERAVVDPSLGPDPTTAGSSAEEAAESPLEIPVGAQASGEDGGPNPATNEVGVQEPRAEPPEPVPMPRPALPPIPGSYLPPSLSQTATVTTVGSTAAANGLPAAPAASGGSAGPAGGDARVASVPRPLRASPPGSSGGAGAVVDQSSTTRPAGIAGRPMPTTAVEAPNDIAGWTLAIGSFLSVIAFVLPWATSGMGIIGASDIGSGYFETWGLANPANILVVLFGAFVLALVLVPSRVPIWLREGALPIVLGGVDLGIWFTYVVSPFGDGIGLLVLLVAGALLIAGGVLALRPGRHVAGR